MAYTELYLVDVYGQQKVSIVETEVDGKNLMEMCFYERGVGGEIIHSFYMDKSTSIKLSKVVRTEINKMTAKESEVSHE